MGKLRRLRKKGEFSEERAHGIYGTVATGELFYPMLARAVEKLNTEFGTRLSAVPVQNVFFGEGVNVAGLLSGVDFLGAKDRYRGEFLMVPGDCYRDYDLRFLDGTTIGELAGELALPIKRGWNQVLGLPEEGKARHLPVLSHNYGSVASIST